MVDWGNFFIVLLALPAGFIGYLAGRFFTYWMDLRLVTWATILVFGLGVPIPAFISWLFVEAVSPASILLPITASLAGLCFGIALGAWQTSDRGGWRTADRDVEAR